MRIAVILHGVFARMRAFPKAKRGNVAMIFGLALLPLCIAAGMGLDMSRAMITRARMGAALDAAGLAVGSQPGMDLADMQKIARQYFKQNYTADTGSYGTPTDVSVTRPDNSQTITLSTSVAMPTVLMRVVGIDTMSVNVSSQITWGQTKLWVALVLDNTGSMCEPGSQPCTTPLTTSKIYALKQATHNLLQMLQNAAANPGDVKVSIVPFSKDVNVGSGQTAASWVDWTNWDAAPPNSTPSSSVGPGSNCPYGTNTSPYGYGCMISPANGSPTTSKVPSYAFPYNASTSYSSGTQVTYNGNTYIYTSGSSRSGKTPSSNPSYWTQVSTDYAGYICPSQDNARYNSGNGSTVLDAAAHYYNGCYNSVPTNTLTTTDSTPTTTTTTASCTSNQNGTCTGNTTTTTSTSTGNTSETTATTSGYSGNSTTTSTSVGAATTGNPVTTSSGRNNNRTYTTTTTTTQVTTTTTVTKTGAAPFNHTWIHNDHSTWAGCIMDRAQDYDTLNTSPASSFPAENTDYCPPGTVTPLGDDWTTLSSQVDAMNANGNTNQTIGVAWGWQTLTNSDPFNPGDLPVDTRKVLILLTDGLNTQNRWSGSQSTIDARTALACRNIQADGITIYTVQVNTGGDPTSTVLQNCASDTSKYFMLTAANQIVSTFQTIGTQITNLRVSL